MAGITLEQATEHLNLWLEADKVVSTGQEYYIGNRKMTRADASEIRKNIDYWQHKVTSLSRGGGIKVHQVVPR